MSLKKGSYQPNIIEKEILQFWLKNEYYKPEYDPFQNKVLSTKTLINQIKTGKKTPFTIINPPPNAYARPHLGNVSGYAYQDLMGRFARMNGKTVLLQPGKDHAGIQGEIVVLREHFAKQNQTKKSLGRQEFYKQTYAYFQKIMQQAQEAEQQIGLSADFSRDIFTLHPQIVQNVLTTFIKLYEDGLVYKGVRIVNWCPSCQTVLADIDTEKKERQATFTYIKYPLIATGQKIGRFTKKEWTTTPPPLTVANFLKQAQVTDIVILIDEKNHFATQPYKIITLSKYQKNLSGEKTCQLKNITATDFTNYITVATTRAETMLGDTAVVVNPTDKRYKKIIGQQLLLPLTWRPIPIITDPGVEKDLGSGALKLTPAHAPEDYGIMLRWNAQQTNKTISYINVIGKDNKMCGPVGKYFNLPVDQAKEQIINDLQTKGYIERIDNKKQQVSVCERCKQVIEPMMSSQWFVNVSNLKKPAIEVVEKGQIKIHPKYMTKKYLHWMRNLRDWPISRSLWWGYRLPVWYKGKIVESIDSQGKIYMTIAEQPVVDFADALKQGLAKVSIQSPVGTGWIQDKDVFDTWFSSGQWPVVTLEKSGLQEAFYPTSVMETGYDILELWVSRMIMLGIYRTGKVPFKDVYLHGVIKAVDGQKMSKSKGNVVLPDAVIKEYGADTLRLFYIVGNKAGRSYQLTEEKLKGHRNFLNKIWNSTKFVLFNINDLDINELTSTSLNPTDHQENFLPEDQTMLQELQKISALVTQKITNFRFGSVAIKLQQSFWSHFCDQYLEQVKSRLYTKDRQGNSINQSPTEQTSRQAAQVTLYLALHTYLRLLHPYIPFITEHLWQNIPHLPADHISIMYSTWPEKEKIPLTDSKNERVYQKNKVIKKTKK